MRGCEKLKDKNEHTYDSGRFISTLLVESDERQILRITYVMEDDNSTVRVIDEKSSEDDRDKMIYVLFQTMLPLLSEMEAQYVVKRARLIWNGDLIESVSDLINVRVVQAC